MILLIYKNFTQNLCRMYENINLCKKNIITCIASDYNNLINKIYFKSNFN